MRYYFFTEEVNNNLAASDLQTQSSPALSKKSTPFLEKSPSSKIFISANAVQKAKVWLFPESPKPKQMATVALTEMRDITFIQGLDVQEPLLTFQNQPEDNFESIIPLQCSSLIQSPEESEFPAAELTQLENVTLRHNDLSGEFLSKKASLHGYAPGSNVMQGMDVQSPVIFQESPGEDSFVHTTQLEGSAFHFQSPEGSLIPAEVTPPENVSVLPQHDISAEFLSISAAPDSPGTIVKQGQNVRKALFPPSTSDGFLTTLQRVPELSTTSSTLPLQADLEREPSFLDESVDAQEESACSEEVIDVVMEEPDISVQTGSRKRKRNSEISDQTPPKKRLQNPSKWKTTQAKLQLNSGVAHTSLTGKPVAAKEMKPACNATCRRKYSGKITRETRLKLFQKYYALKSKSLQWNMINKMVRAVPVKQRTTDNEDEVDPYRKQSFEYSLLNDDGNAVTVCQTIFLNTFAISSTVVKTACHKNSPDKRGTNVNHKKRLPQVLIQSVKDHMKEFPTVESHYCREDIRKKYLDENLSIAKMHRLYLLERGELPNTANVRQYRDIFNTCFNLSFFKPKKDQCASCVQWEQFSPEEKEKFSPKHQEHIDNKNTARGLKKSDKEFSINQTPQNIRVLTFDLQKVFYCPKSEVGEFFYKRKLSSYNFTIFDCTTGQAVCYVWDQTVAKRGSDEIASCVLMYFEETVKKGVNEFRIYSDSCSGQNKNQFLYSMYYLAARRYNIKIIHRYLEKGHTQMECDSVHAQIERKTRHIDIFTPAQWYGYIKSAKVQKPQYIVKELDQEIILSFKDAAQHLSWAKVPISKIKEITIVNSSPDVVAYKLQFNSDCKVVKILPQNKRGRPVNWTTFNLHPAYSGPLPLKPKLVKDLEWYLKKDLIPTPFVPFYVNLTSQPAAAEDDESDVPEEREHQRELFEDEVNDN
ncbi:hypothetical protein FOCC_FOCC014920 [Frankliniella occidentalis]|nr:hypothetical protein FOCC_FOCC014920 [Frankliniella occidentalis]